jgi:hypothetical protein
MLLPTVAPTSPGYWTGYSEDRGNDAAVDDEIRDQEEENNDKAPVGDEVEEANIDSDPGPEKMSRDGMLGEQPAQRASESKDVISRILETLDALSPNLKVEVEGALRKYRQSFSSTPGLCIDYEYEFEVENHVPFTAKERQIPYIMREAVREQIEMMNGTGNYRTGHVAILEPPCYSA